MKTVSIKFLLYVQGVTKLLQQVLITMCRMNWSIGFCKIQSFNQKKIGGNNSDLVVLLHLFFVCLFFLLFLFKKRWFNSNVSYFCSQEVFFRFNGKKSRNVSPMQWLFQLMFLIWQTEVFFPTKENFWLLTCIVIYFLVSNVQNQKHIWQYSQSLPRKNVDQKMLFSVVKLWRLRKCSKWISRIFNWSIR